MGRALSLVSRSLHERLFEAEWHRLVAGVILPISLPQTNQSTCNYNADKRGNHPAWKRNSTIELNAFNNYPENQQRNPKTVHRITSFLDYLRFKSAHAVA